MTKTGNHWVLQRDWRMGLHLWLSCLYLTPLWAEWWTSHSESHPQSCRQKKWVIFLSKPPQCSMVTCFGHKKWILNVFEKIRRTLYKRTQKNPFLIPFSIGSCKCFQKLFRTARNALANNNRNFKKTACGGITSLWIHSLWSFPSLSQLDKTLC